MFGIRTDGLRVIHDYPAAKQHYESITPIRGSTIRPIGKRNKEHMRIVESRNEHGHYYAAQLYNTECVRWYENEKIQVRCDGWTSQSTAKFIDAVSPFNSHLQHNHLWVNGSAMNDTRDGLWFERQKDEYGGYKWVCLNPPKYYIKTLSKEVTKHIRNLPAVKAAQQYLKHMAALGVYDGVKGGFIWVREKPLTHMLQNPDTEPNLETLAALGDIARGPVPWDVVYKVALQANIITEDQLYNKTYITEHVNRKGVYTE